MLENLDWQKIIKHLASYATSAAAHDLLLQTSPLDTQEQALDNFRIIANAQSLLSHGERPFMESLDLFHSWSHRLEKQAQLKPLELKDVRLFLIEGDTLRRILKNSPSKWGESILRQMMDLKPPLSAIDHLITPQAEIRVDASETLYNLYNEKKNQIQKIQSSLNSIVKSNANDNMLQDKFVTNREGRWVIPVKSGMRHELSGIIHATSTSKQTVFMEPQEVVPLNNHLKRIEAEIEEEIEKLLNEISKYLFSLLDDILKTKDIMLECDLRLAQA
ncbi:endonuclease MutS2, partial [bacterium]|nr:endonuclease MutS2 [bacterium]